MVAKVNFAANALRRYGCCDKVNARHFSVRTAKSPERGTTVAMLYWVNAGGNSGYYL